tara:strand:- start:1600 stop:2160 length:561 start_codon:yes stop_codon:yes gene_type:complete
MLSDETFGDWPKPPWDDWYMGMAFYVAQRSPDPATKHGSIFVTQNHSPIVFGYNAFPQDSFDDEIPTTRPEKYDYMIHSEENCISMAAEQGLSLKDSVVYITGHPCVKCFRMMLRAGVKEIIHGNVSSNCVTAENIATIGLMNRSKSMKAKTSKNVDKIYIHRYEGNVDFLSILQRTITYAKIKSF